MFCAREAVKRFIDSRVLGGGWYVREFSVGELSSLLFALHERVAWVLFSTLRKREALGRADTLLTQLIDNMPALEEPADAPTR